MRVANSTKECREEIACIDPSKAGVFEALLRLREI